MKKLLIVDDNPLNVFTLKNHLRHLEVIIDSATCAADTYLLHQKNIYDIIFLDYYLPDATGLEITRKILEYDEQQQRQNPILISISADSNPAMQQSLLASGVDRILQKPVTKLQLLDALQPYMPGADLSASPDHTDHPAQMPGIHFHELKKWLPSNEDEARKFITEFLHTTQEGVNTLKQAAHEHNLSKIILEAHRLKTPPKAFGMYQLAAQLETLQLAAQNAQPPSHIDGLLHSLQISLHGIEQQLDKLFAS